MPFDLSTAKPIDEAAQPSAGGFDLSTAKPEGAPAVLPTPPAAPQNPLTRTISNIPTSAAHFAGNLYQAVRHPIDTASGILDIGAGGLQSLLAPESFKQSGNPMLYDPKAAEAWQAMKGLYKQRYGSLGAAGETIQTDPVGFMADVASVAAPGARLAGMTGLPKVAGALEKVSEVTNPVGLAVKGAQAVAPVAGNVYSHLTGITTGSGKAAIDQAIKGSDEFVKAMRGNTSDAQVLEMAREGVQKLKTLRGENYRTELQNLKGSTQTIDISPIKQKMDIILRDYNVKKNPDGTLDFSRSTLKEGAKDIQGMFDDVQSWGTKAGDNTPAMLDTLKRRISDRFSESGQARAAISSMSDFIKNRIAFAVPEYAQMTQKYAKDSETIGTIEKALSTGDRAAADTAMRKIIQGMKEEKPTRRAMLDALGAATGENITAAAGGRLMSPAWTNRLGPIAHFYGTSAVAAYLHNPLLAGLLPLASPRLVGELTVLLGNTLRAGTTAADRSKLAALYGAQESAIGGQEGNRPANDQNQNEQRRRVQVTPPMAPEPTSSSLVSQIPQ